MSETRQASNVAMILVAGVVMLSVALIYVMTKQGMASRPAPEPARPYTEFTPNEAMGPVVRVGKGGKIEIRTATEAEYRETIGNLASTVVQLGIQLDQLKNPKPAVKDAKNPPAGTYPDHTGLEPVTPEEEQVPPTQLPLPEKGK